MTHAEIPIALDFTTPPKATATAGSKTVRDIRLGENERFARNPHNPLIRSATGRGGQLPRQISDVRADDGKVAAVEFPNVRTTTAAGSLRAIGMRVRAESSQKHITNLTIVRCDVKHFFHTSSLWFTVDFDQTRQEVCSQVARLLRAERERQKLSMTALAERAGLSQQMVSYVERGMRSPTLETLLRIAAALEIDLANVIRAAQKPK